MIDLALKNILRQKTRTVLTIVGIMIGIGAVVALGSISEGINKMINEEMKFLGGTILISSKGSGGMMTGFQGSNITEDEVKELEEFSGVKEAVPLVMRAKRVKIGEPLQMIFGIDPEHVDFFKTRGTEVEFGRGLEEGDTFQVLIGHKLSEDYGINVGDMIELKDYSFEVVGIIEETETNLLDYCIVVPIKTMMNVFEIENYQAVFVVPQDLTRVEDVADDIKDNFDDFEVTTSTDIVKQMSRIVDMLRFFTIGIGSIAAIVGGVGVMNTMVMSVMERKKEIGIMKAIGATNKFVLTQILIESIIITLIGGLLGIIVGVMGSYSLRFVSSGLASARVTPVLIFGGTSFAVFLGLIGGLYPAWQASKLDPIEALRYE